METSHEQLKPLDMSEGPRASELIKLIRKLRWMRMDEEAERAATALGTSSPKNSVVATPSDTD